MGKKYTTDIISIGDHSLDAPGMVQIDALIADGLHSEAGYLTEESSTTRLTDAEIAEMGYIKTYTDTDTNTQLTSAEIAAMGYLTEMPSHSHNYLYHSSYTPLANIDLDSISTSGVYQSAGTYASNPNIPYANYFTMLHLDNENGRAAQLWFGDSPGRMYYRPKQGANTWHPWEHVITSGGISQTKAGLLQSNASLRAPIFYDSINTDYYLNPAGTSNLNVINATGGTSTEWNTAHGWGNHADAGYITTDNNTTYNFAGSTFTSRNNGNPIAIDSATSNMTGYTNSSAAAGYSDGGLFVAAYSTSWVSQIFSNFRTGELSARGKNNGTWQGWRTIHDSGHFSTADVANGVTAHGWGNHADEGYLTSYTDTNTQLTSAQIAAMGYASSGFDSVANLSAPNTTVGTWNTSTTVDWGTPRIGSSVGRYIDNAGSLSFAVPAGMKTAYISQLTWSSGGYADVYGIQADGDAIFLRRINTKQNVENSNHGNPNQHDGSTIAFAGHIGDYPTIRISNKSGRLHLTGLGFSKSEVSASDGTGMVNPSQFSTPVTYSSISGTPSIPSGNSIIDWTANQGSTNIHSGNYTNTTYDNGDFVDLSSAQTVGGIKTFTSDMVIKNGDPTLGFADTTANADDFYIHVNSNNFYVLADRDDSGLNNGIGGWDGSHPLQLESDTNKAYTFGNEIYHTGNIPTWNQSTTGTANNATNLGGINASEYAHGTEGSFTVGGSRSNFYPVKLSKGRMRGVFTIYRENVHENGTSFGSGRLIIRATTSGWGHTPLKFSYEAIVQSNHLFGFLTSNYRTGYMMVMLRGGTTYHYIGSDTFKLSDGNASGVSLSDGRTTYNATALGLDVISYSGEAPSYKHIPYTNHEYGDTAKKFSGSVTAPIFYGGLTGNATTATTAADANLLDGIDSSRIVYGHGERKSTRADSVGIMSTTQNSGFHYGSSPTNGPTTDWNNWITCAGGAWTSGNNYDFKISHPFHSDKLYVGRMTNGVNNGWRQILTTGMSVDIGASYSFTGAAFYDASDTQYLVDPGGASAFNRIRIINNTTPFMIKVNSNYKTWVHHIASDDTYVFAPSTANGGETWDWNNQMSITSSGVVTANNFVLRSDERSKTKIENLTRNNIDVSWKSFEMKGNEGDYRTGVIAQELEETHPEFVNTDAKGFKSVKYIDLLIAKIAELEARLEKLEK